MGVRFKVIGLKFLGLPFGLHSPYNLSAKRPKTLNLT